MASDSSTHTVKNSEYDPETLVSVAIAVDDLDDFNDQYHSIVSDGCSRHDVSPRRSVVKSYDLNEFAPEWEREAALRDIVENLLQIDTIANVHFTETTLGEEGQEVIPAYRTEGTPQVLGPEEARKDIRSYYNLVPVWDYLRNYGDASFGYHNVMVDDFGGKETDIWYSIGEKSERLRVIPKGDEVYPLLAMTDLTMSYIAQEVSDWHEDAIQDHLENVTPDKSAFANARSIDSMDDLKKIVPRSRRPVKTQIHHPHPRICLERGKMDKKKMKTTEVFDQICEYAKDQEGCVKFFNESQDLKHMNDTDYLVSLDETADLYRKYKNISNMYPFDVVGPDNIEDTFSIS